jgi:hypothetical protein
MHQTITGTITSLVDPKIRGTSTRGTTNRRTVMRNSKGAAGMIILAEEKMEWRPGPVAKKASQQDGQGIEGGS